MPSCSSGEWWGTTWGVRPSCSPQPHPHSAGFAARASGQPGRPTPSSSWLATLPVASGLCSAGLPTPATAAGSKSPNPPNRPLGPIWPGQGVLGPDRQPVPHRTVASWAGGQRPSIPGRQGLLAGTLWRHASRPPGGWAGLHCWRGPSGRAGSLLSGERSRGVPARV